MRSLFPRLVLYRWRPGQVRAGMMDATAMMTKINPDGTLNLIVWPDRDRDPLFQTNVAEMSDTVQGHCWHLPDDDTDARIAALEERIATLEAKRGPGRPPSVKVE